MKINIKNINYKRISYHVLFWVVIVLLYDVIQSLVLDIKYSSFIYLDLYYTPADILGVYFTIYFLFPKLLYKKKYYLFAIFTAIFIFILTVGISMPMQFEGIKKVLGEKYIAEKKDLQSLYEFIKSNFLRAITVKLMIIGIASAIKLSTKWIKLQKQQQILEKEKLEIALKLKESELKFLKSQINPHFLFNALNNLYSLTLENSDDAPDNVLKISSLLDYMLYDCNVAFINLDKEIKSLKNYIDLQKIRYGNDAKIALNVDGDASDMDIAPLLLLPYVENAFKHGLTKNMGKGRVDININIEENRFTFIIENDKRPSDEIVKKNNGIGLKNVEKRLELQYKNKYDLKIENKKHVYRVKLIITNFDK